jgi:isoleucyl-tRNA synthetase
VTLDLEVTADHESEGIARDVIRQIQSARRDAGLAVSDRIVVKLVLPDAAAMEAVKTHLDLVKGEVLAVDLQVNEGPLSIEIKKP